MMSTNPPGALLVHHVMNFSVPTIDMNLLACILRNGPQAPGTGQLGVWRFPWSGDDPAENMVASEIPMMCEEIRPNLSQVLFR